MILKENAPFAIRIWIDDVNSAKMYLTIFSFQPKIMIVLITEVILNVSTRCVKYAGCI